MEAIRAAGSQGLALTELLLIRHAHAKSRGSWRAADHERPLDRQGERQAQRLAVSLAGRRPQRIVTSPFLRCLQTVEPLAEALGISLEQDGRLGEGVPAGQALALLEELRGEAVAICTHGEVIAQLIAAPHSTAKAATWLLDPATLAPVEYLAPPSGRA
jgi:phosphohistidine phosphatase SixA